MNKAASNISSGAVQKVALFDDEAAKMKTPTIVSVAGQRDEFIPPPDEQDASDTFNEVDVPMARQSNAVVQNINKIMDRAEKKTNPAVFVLMPIFFAIVFCTAIYFINGELPFQKEIEPLISDIKQIESLRLENFPENIMNIKLPSKEKLLSKIPYRDELAEYLPALKKPVVVKKKIKPKTPKQILQDKKVAFLKTLPVSPYRDLPNRLAVPATPVVKSWTKEEETDLRSRLKHPFHYQRYKVVDDVVQKRLKGSEVVLRESLKSRKLWIRMNALMGLVDFGIPVSTEQVVVSIGKEPSERLENYFKRYIVKSKPAERFIMQEALRTVDERSRVVILKALQRADDPFYPQYLQAAALDKSDRVKRWWSSAQKTKIRIALKDNNKIKMVNNRTTKKVMPIVRGVKTSQVIQFKSNPKLQ